MGDPMQGIAEDVPFSVADAEALQSACTAAASQILFQQGSRSSWVHTAMGEFKGYFSQLFASNATTAAADGSEVVQALTATATAVGKLITDAKAEQKRRTDARAWKEHHDHRGFGGWVDDTFGDGDDCPIPEATAQLSFNPPPPAATPRQTPAVGAYGGGGGTSSAKPEDLHTFANGSRGANSELAGKPGALKTKYATFQSSCTWGSLSAAGVFSGFESWLSANENDVTWAKTVGDAFERAGSDGAVSTLPNTAIDAALKAAGVDEARTDLTIAMPSALGSPPTTGYANDPVNTSTGNFIETEVDLEFTDAAADLWWRRSYNSVHAHTGAFGPGWSSWCDAGLSFSDEAAAFTLPDGRQISFPRLGAGWDRATGENLWLTREGAAADETLVVSGNDGTRWVHTAAGRLTSYVAGEGRAVTLVWEGDRLVGLSHERGRSIELTWDGDLVVAATASDGRRFTYDHDSTGRLVAATGPLGTRRYDWDDAGLIARVVDADGVVEVDNVYDEHGRVTAQRSPFGRTTRFAYLPGRVTVVSDEDGTRANTWLADAQGRLVGVIDAADQRQSMAYDEHGNKVMTTDRDGTVTISEYDERGRRVREVSPSGADVTYAYDEADRVVRVEVTGADPMVDPDETASSVTTYDYDGEQRNPSVITDPEGGTTRLEWAGGLLSRVTDPMGVVVEMGYDAGGELVSTTNGAGDVARLERDDLGRVAAAITPSGNRTRYVYDPGSGLLAERVNPDGSTWTYEHTAAGRIHAIVDPQGGRTERELGSHGEEATSIDPLGRAVRRTYDDLGNLAGAILPDGSRWEFAHDALGRLVRVTDPAGGVATTEFDVGGAPSATTDPTGVRREVHDVQAGAGAAMEVVDGPASTRLDVDKLGRLVSETQSDGTTRLTRYDRCGRPVEIVDPVGGLTRLVRDAAGRVTTMVTPSGGEIGYTYDPCGRLATITDQSGATSTRAYDADSRVVEQRLPTGDVATTRYDECGRVVALRFPGSGTTTYAYDAVGRVVETRNPANGRRRFAYDAAGQLVAATDANGGVTAYAYDVNGRCTEITHPDGGVTRREYDATNHVVAETDPLGRRTTATYDAAGRQVTQTGPDGSTTEWRHDQHGMLASTWVDGVEQSTIERDVPGRKVRIIDRTGLSAPAGEVTVHELEWDARGLLVSRTRDGRGARWDFDPDGHCTSLTAPDGTRTTYARDAAGRLVGVTHPLLGLAVIERDAAGRMVAATAGGTRQQWGYTDGHLTSHESRRTDGTGSRTTIARDDDGRVTELYAVDDSGEHTTAYSYDEARQLVAAATTTAEGTDTVRWRYDVAGRLVGESLATDGSQVSRELVYDRAGQLTATRVDGEDVSTYSYDQRGRRVGESYADGSARAFSWSPTGWLSAISSTDRLGDTRRTDLVVDALGELARVDDAEVFTDSANPWNGLIGVGDQQIVHAGPFTGLAQGGDGDWTDPGWREARASGPDPWSLPGEGVPRLPTGPSTGFELSPTGDLSVDGLEWRGNRVYDSSSRGFLSVDPVEPTTGAAWAGNPYSYAGNDPMHALDPMGLHPVTDAELKAYNAHNGGFMDSAAGKWLKNNWEYVAGGAMVIAGGVLMATGVGGPAGMMLVSAGADTIIQKATTGHVNWGEVAVSGALGGFSGAGVAARAGLTGFKATVAAGVVSGGVSGAGTGAYTYLSGPGPHSPGGLLAATGEGAGMGMVTGGAGAAAGHGLSAVGGRVLGHTEPVPVMRGGPGDPYAHEVVAGGRPDGQTVFAGHGEYRVGSGDVTVPEGTRVHVYSEYGDPLRQSDGLAVEQGGGPQPVRSYGPGESLPDYTLKSPDGLTIASGSTTVEDPTRLSSLLQPGMGDTHWAACTNVR